MKKILSILMILALVGGVAFAQITPSVDASASVNWGIDFGGGKDKTQHGFENLLVATVDVPLYKNKLNSKTEGDVRMNFDLGVNLLYQFDDVRSNSDSAFKSFSSDAKFSLAEDVLSDMSASIHFFGGYMNVFGRPNFTTNFARIWTPIRDNASPRPDTKGDITGFGTKLGYKSDNFFGTGLKFDTGLKFASNGSWKAKGKEAVTGEDGYIKVTLTEGKKVTKEEADTIVREATKLVVDGKETWVVLPSAVKQSLALYGYAEGHIITKADSEKVFYKEGKVGVTPAEDPVQGKYAFGFDLSLGYDKWVTFDFGMNLTFDPVSKFGNAGVAPYKKGDKSVSNVDKTYLGMGFKLGSKPVEGFALNFAMDTLMNVGKDSKVAFDLVFDAAYKWVKFGAYYGNELSNYKGNKDGKDIGDMAMMLAFKSDASGDTNLVNGLAFGVDFRLNKLLTEIPAKGTVPMGLSTWVDYKYNITDAMWVKPYAKFWAETNSKTDLVFGFAYKVGAVFSPMEKVEVEASWSHGKLNWNKYEGYKQADAEGKMHSMLSAPAINAHNGTIVLGVKVKY